MRFPKTLPFTLATLMSLSSCGFYKWWGDKTEKDRHIASVSIQHLLDEDDQSFAEDMEERLKGLHSYYVLGQKFLVQFDSEIASTKIENMYTSTSYLSLLAIRTQVEEIEHEIIEVWDKSSKNKDNKAAFKKKFQIQLAIAKFANLSKASHLSMENLLYQLSIQGTENDFKFKSLSKSLTKKDISEEISKLKTTKEFQVYEKNIEHLSHMMETDIESGDRKFYPSSTKSGNITGNEFPAKVWALTFDDGPRIETSPLIVESLKERQMDATFFQLAAKVKDIPETAKLIRDAGMQIASHSWNHLQLTKVGAHTLNVEILEGTQEIEKIQEVKIKFFRLPYGAGVSVNTIREKIASSGLIHVFWNVDTLDWMAQSPEQIVTRTRALMAKTDKDSGVILFHDIHERTTIAAPQIMDDLKLHGRRACNLDTIVAQINDGSETVCPK